MPDNRSIGRRKSHSRSRPSKTRAASELPPPSPPPTGIRLSRPIRRPEAADPATSAIAVAARSTRLEPSQGRFGSSQLKLRAPDPAGSIDNVSKSPTLHIQLRRGWYPDRSTGAMRKCRLILAGARSRMNRALRRSRQPRTCQVARTHSTHPCILSFSCFRQSCASRRERFMCRSTAYVIGRLRSTKSCIRRGRRM